MHLNESLSYVFGEIRSAAHRAVVDLDRDALAWRPDPEANSIGWLVWHLARVEDSHVAHVAGSGEVWNDQWATSLGLSPGYDDTGYAHTPIQVGAIQPSAEPLLRYLDAVTEMVQSHLRTVSSADFDEVIDRSYDPPVTVGVRFASVVGDAWQHVGQAAYVRGLLERSR